MTSRGLGTALAAVALATASSIASAQTTVAGSTPGSFRVTESGAAEYRIPIRVPPGIAGMEPKLALVYNSQGSNGLLGMGWHLEGLSAITRCPRTMAQDGARGGVNNDWNDRYCLDGQRLMLIAGSYGSNGAEYRTERDAFTKVNSYGTGGSGPVWFEVRTKDGQIFEYGNTPDSRIEAWGTATVAVWAVNRVTDRKGNFLTATYWKDTGAYYPERIDYGTSSVRFEYQTRADVSDHWTGGSIVRTRDRLANVQTYAGTAMVKELRVAYDNGGAAGRSRLVSLTECAPGSTCLAPHTFKWTRNDFSLGGSDAGYPGGWNRDYSTLHAGDFNGDGRTDFFQQSNTAWGGNGATFFSNGDGTFNKVEAGMPGGWNSDYVTLVVGDFNGDGKSDLFYQRNTTWGGSGTVFLSNGDGTFAQVDPGNGDGWNRDYSTLHAGDFNGDGLTDLFQQANTAWGGNGALFLSNGNGTFNKLVDPDHPGGWNSDYSTLHVGDFNGDGRTDLFQQTNSAWGGNGAAFLSNGNGTFTKVVDPAYGGVWNREYSRVVAGDFNGDGKTDLFQHGNTAWGGGGAVWLSKGNGFFERIDAGHPGGWNLDYSTLVAGDFNGDGRTDLFHYANSPWGGGAAFVIFNGNGGLEKIDAGSPGGWNLDFVNVLPADLDGDGKADLFKQNGTTWGGLGSWHRYGTYGVATDAVASIGESAGGSITLEYKSLANSSLADSSVYSKDSGPWAAAYPNTDVKHALYVVSQATRSGGGTSSTTTHKYGGLKVNYQGRGMLGFRWLEATDNTGLRVRSEFRQEWPYVGLPFSVMKTHIPSGVVLSQVTSNYYGCINTVTGDPCSIGPGKTYFPFVSQSIETPNALTSSSTIVALPTVTTATQYDRFGNPTSITVTASDGHSKTTTNTFTNDEASWLIGRLTRSVVLSTSP